MAEQPNTTNPSAGEPCEPQVPTNLFASGDLSSFDIAELVVLWEMYRSLGDTALGYLNQPRVQDELLALIEDHMTAMDIAKDRVAEEMRKRKPEKQERNNWLSVVLASAVTRDLEPHEIIGEVIACMDSPQQAAA